MNRHILDLLNRRLNLFAGHKAN